MDKNLKEGQFLPRWSGELNNGFGYPVFIFIYPLPAILGEVFHLIGFGFVDSVKAVMFMSLITSALGMYLFLNTWLKNNEAAFLGSLFYLYAPVRFLNVYVSAAVGSSLAMTFLPLVFWVLVKLAQNGGLRTIVIGALTIACLVTSHNVTALMFAPFILGFSLLMLYYSKERLRVFKKYLLMGLLGLGLSAWFFIPAIFEGTYIRYFEVVGKVYLDQFPSLQQLVYSPWGFGLSHPQTPGGMSYQVGLIHWLVVIISIGLIFVYWKKIQFRVTTLFFLFFFIVSIFLMLKISLPLWDNLPGLNLMQYPFRILAVSVFTASVLAAFLIKYLPYRKVITVFLAVLVLYANRNHLGINQQFNPGEQYYLSLKTTTTTHGEHLPKWGRIATESALTKLEFIQGEGKIEYNKETSVEVVASIESSSSAVLRFNQFYFPGWEFKMNGQKARFDYLQKGENYGLPVFEIPAGKNIVLAKFVSTPDRIIADSISILSLVTLLTLFLYAVHRVDHSVAV